MSWKKFGGIKQFDSFTNFNVNSITTDDFVMRESYKGTFTISGELFVSSDCSLNANVGIGKNVMISDSCYVEDTIFIGNNERNTQKMIRTSTTGLGINVADPVAILDISGSSSKIMNVSSSHTTVSSTILRNGDGNTVDFSLDNSGAALSFSFPDNREVSISYDVSGNFLSVNTDISFAGNNVIGRNATVARDLLVYENAVVHGNVAVGRNLTVSGDIILSGDLNLKGNADMKNATIRNDIIHHGNIKINGNNGIWFNTINDSNAVIRPYTDKDVTRANIAIPKGGGTQLFLNCDVIIGGNVYIDGSTNIIGNITQLTGITSGGTNIDASGTLADLSGTDQSKFYVNFQNKNAKDLAGSGFYIYNRLSTPNINVNPVLEDYYHLNGFVKISDESPSKFSLRTTGERNTVALDLAKLKNVNKSGLLVLKHANAFDSDKIDNYNIISSHTDMSSIDVSNSLTGIVDLYVGNLVSCGRNMSVGGNLSVAGNLRAVHGNITDLKGNSIDVGFAVVGNLKARELILDFGQDPTEQNTNYKGYQSVATMLIGIHTAVVGNSITKDDNNYYGGVNTFNEKTIFLDDISLVGLFTSSGSISSGSISAGRATITEAAFLTGSSSLYDTSMNGNIDISGSLSVTGASCIFKNSIAVVNDISLNGVLYATNGTVVTKDISANRNIVVGNSLTVVNKFTGKDILCTGLVESQSAKFTGTAFLTGSSSLYDTSMNGNIDISGSLSVTGASCIFKNSIAVVNDISLNGVLYATSGTVVTKDISANRNIVVGNSLTVVNKFIGKDILCTGLVESRSAKFTETAYLTGSSFLYDTSMNGNIDISGSLSVTGASCIFKNSIAVVNDISLDGILYATSGTVVTKDISANRNIVVGNSLTVVNKFIGKDILCTGLIESQSAKFTEKSFLSDTDLNGNIRLFGNVSVHGDFHGIGSCRFNNSFVVANDIALEGNLYASNCTIIGNTSVRGNLTLNGNLSTTNDISCGRHLYVAGDIHLDDGKLRISYESSDYEITPKLFSYMKNVSSDIQTQINTIDGKATKNNTFSGDNTFSGTNRFVNGNLTVDTLNVDNFHGNTLFLYENLQVEGHTQEEKIIFGPNTFFYKHIVDGDIYSERNIYCTGNKILRYTCKNSENKLGLTELSYANFMKSVKDNTNEWVFTPDEVVEGGLVECLDISLGRTFDMFGGFNMYGTIKAESTTFTPQVLKNALSAFPTTPEGDNKIIFGLSTSKIYIPGSLLVSSTFACADVRTSATEIFSDYRLKDNIQTISGSNHFVDHLRPVTYTLKETGKAHIGFIAHELQDYFPSMVSGTKDGPVMQSVNYTELIPILVKEIQDLKKEINLLKQKFV